jgi:hypothetical protein
MAGLGAFNVKDVIDAANVRVAPRRRRISASTAAAAWRSARTPLAFAEAKIQNVYSKTTGVISRSSIQTVPSRSDCCSKPLLSS